MIYKSILASLALLATPALAQNNTLANYAASPPPLSLTLRTGFLSQIPAGKIVFDKVAASMRVGYVAAKSDEFNCDQNPVVTFYDCGTDHSCAGGTALGSVTLTSAGALATATPTGATLAGGDYYAWAITGSCTALDVSAKAATQGP